MDELENAGVQPADEVLDTPTEEVEETPAEEVESEATDSDEATEGTESEDEAI